VSDQLHNPPALSAW